MRNNSLLFYFIVLVMTTFTIAFFRSEDFMPLLRNWQANKYLEQSKGYRNIGIIKSDRFQDEDAVKTAERAYLLAPDDMAIARNLAEVYYEVNPEKGLAQWETVVNMPGVTLEDRIRVVRLALKVSAETHARSRDRILALGQNRMYFLNIARRQLELLSRNDRFSKRPEFGMALAEFSAESGDLRTALSTIVRLRSENKDPDPKLELLFCRIAIHTKRPQLMKEAAVALRKLAEGSGQSALKAMRYFVFIHSEVHPLSSDEIQHLHSLLESNHPPSEDRLRVRRMLHSIELDLTDDQIERSRIIERCAKHFDLSIDSDLEIYCNWLGNENELKHLLMKLPLRRVNRTRSEKLFRIRLAALANLGRFNELVNELEQSSVLKDYWQYAFSARALSADRRFAESEVRLNKLVDAIDDDDRKVLAVCQWLEESGDSPSLCHVLEKLSDVSPYEAFCADGLLRYRIKTAKLGEIQNWIATLAKSKPTDLKLQNNLIYWNLLSPSPTESQLDDWLKESRLHLEGIPKNLQCRITVALVLLRKDLPVEALVALEDPPGSSHRTPWKKVRSAWARIYAIALARNQRTEESVALLDDITKRPKRPTSQAEQKALAFIFSDELPTQP